MMKNLRQASVLGKKVLVRVDFNIYPVRPRELRIERTLPTIRWLLKRGAREIILMTHIETNDGHLPSVRALVRYLRQRRFPMGGITFLENLRKSPGEVKNNPAFAKKLARLGDLYVNEAFAVSHRQHASLVLLPKLLPSYCGFLFASEIKNLSKVFRPPHPFTLILGGGKVETKFPLLKSLLPKVDRALLGGIIGNNFLARPLLKSPKIILPEDVVQKGRRIYDVGPRTIANWAGVIKKSKLVVWNGPLGFIEKGYLAGTRKLISAVREARGEVIIGGGDTLDLLPRGFTDGSHKNIFVSTGGGAMLEFLARGTLPGIEALKK